MPARKPVTFGKRGAPAAVRSAAAPGRAAAPANDLELSSTGAPLKEIARSLMAKEPEEAEARDGARKAGAVPTSWRAGILAGLVVSAMQAGFVILKASAGADATTAGLMQMAGVDQAKALPLILAGSLFSGAEATASTILFAHSALKRLRNASFMAYGIGGGLAAGAFAFAQQALGLGEMEHGLALEIATGAAAGFFYRMFAGVRA
jgi:hypothetical protein